MIKVGDLNIAGDERVDRRVADGTTPNFHTGRL